jgi:uncharacterized membrane protein
MTLLLQVLLAVAYALLAHGASAWADDRLAAGALLALVLMLLLPGLAARRAWAWVALPPLAYGCWATWRAGYAALPLLLVPVAFVALIGWVFGRSLGSPRGALITRIVSAMEAVPVDEVAPELRRYTRRLTAAWAWLLGGLAVANLVLALIATPDGLLASLGVEPPLAITRSQWSWFANLLNYGIVGGFFVGEYHLRKRWFPARYRSFGDFLQRMAALGPRFWTDFLR